jgi:hypothetical protein
MASKRNKPKLELESVTRDKIASFFRASGYVVQREVQTPLGRIDVLVREYLPSGEVCYNIIEVKRHNDSHSLKFAVSQLRAYAKHYNEARTKLFFCTSDKSSLSPEARRVIQANPDILYKVF